MGIENSYIAYCFDECCSFIISKIKDGEEPKISHKTGKSYVKHYSKPSDLYKNFDN